MIGTVEKVWPGEKRTDILVRDREDGKIRECYVFMPEGQWIAGLCQTGVGNDRPLVFTLEPQSYWGYKVVEVELMPEARKSYVAQDAELDAALEEIERDICRPEPQGTLADVQMEIDRAHGKQWKDI